MENWEMLMRQAKKAYASKSFHESICLNRQALNYAKMHFQTMFESTPDKAIASVLVCHFNLIDNHISTSDFFEVHSNFHEITLFLNQLEQDRTLNQLQQEAFYRGLMQAHTEWSFFLKNHSDDIDHPKFNSYKNLESSFNKIIKWQQTFKES